MVILLFIMLNLGITFSLIAAENSQIKIMPLGDSITQPDYNHFSYRRKLWIKLNRAGYQVDFIGSQKNNYKGPPPKKDFDQDHEGHWGWRADQILKKIDEWTAKTSPHIVLLHIGTNDIFQNQSNAETLEEIKKIITVLRKRRSNVIVLLAKLIPATRYQQQIISFNTLLKNSMEKMNQSQSKVLIVDQFSGFDPQMDTWDGIHPNKYGEEKMAEKWFQALKKVLPEKSLH